MIRQDPAGITGRQHVFVTGLARAGTTVLMRRFHASGLVPVAHLPRHAVRAGAQLLAAGIGRVPQGDRERRTSTRRPGAGGRRQPGKPRRSVLAGVSRVSEYLREDRLVPHAPSADVVEKYVRYVNAVLAADDTSSRAISLQEQQQCLASAGRSTVPSPPASCWWRFAIRCSTPQSLLRQHRHFAKAQAERPFTLSYMTWLGHHEFGLDHRPFRFGATPRRRVVRAGQRSITGCSGGAIRTRGSSKRSRRRRCFVCYEDLCRQPRNLGAVGGTGRHSVGSARRGTVRAQRTCR